MDSHLATQQVDADRVKLAKWVRDAYQDMKNARNRQELLWYVNLAMYYGNQYVELVPRLSKLQIPKAPPYRVRHISNRIRPMIRTEYSKLTSQKPSAYVIPASSDDEDLMAAYAGEQIWESVSYRNKLRKEFGKSVWWMLLTGTAFMKTWWDNSKIDEYSKMNGDICYGTVTPFHLFVPDLREEEVENQIYVLNAYTKPLGWVKKFYGESINGFNINADVVAADEILNDAYLNLDSNVKKQPDSVLCLEMWVKRGGCDFLDQDAVIHVIGNNVAHVGPMYNHGRYPFTKFSHIPTGKFYGASVIEDIVPLQREYNRTRSQILEAKNRMARPQLLSPKGSVDPTKITNEPGLVIEYRPGLPPPTPLPLQPLPNYVLEELDRNLQDMEDISGQHQVSRGGVPPGVSAATAISFLQEKDDSLLSHTFQDIEGGMENIAHQTLQLVTQFWDTERTVKVAGEDAYFDVLMLKGSDLKDNTDIRMEGGSSLPTSKSAKQALLMDLMKMGFIDPNEGLKLMDIGGVQKLWQSIKRDESQAQRENIRMKRIQPDDVEKFKQEWQQKQQAEMQAIQMAEQMQDPAQAEMLAAQGITAEQMPDPDSFTTIDQATGQPLQIPPVIPVNTWDNHSTHIEIHNAYRKSQAFELLPDVIKAQFEQHVQAHLAAYTSAMQEVQALGAGMGADMGGGMPGEEGPPEESGQDMPPQGGP